MRFGFYTRLAAGGIRKNRRIYLPYILMCAVLSAMYYITSFLQHTDTISGIVGVGTVRFTLNLGGWLLAVFSCVFLIYANAFLMRSRKREFGLYSVFGMDRGNICRVLERETAIVALVSVSGGLVLGIACSKFAELGLMRILGAETNYRLSVNPDAAVMTVAVYTAVFVLQLMNARRQIASATAVELLHSESAGETPPQANARLGVSGMVMLALAYLMAATVDFASAKKLLAADFVAVLLVIGGTYVTMISGSVLLCRVLQRNKRWYYKPAHFVSVSSMAFRMRRNGAGLASICVLVTMVLVMISSTACLFYGSKFDYRVDYPREVLLDLPAQGPESLNVGNTDALRDRISSALGDMGAETENGYDYRFASVSGALNGGDLELAGSAANGEELTVYFVPLEDYQRAAGESRALEPGEALVYSYMGYEFGGVTANGETLYQVADRLEDFPYAGIEAVAAPKSSVYVVVPDMSEAIDRLSTLEDREAGRYVYYEWIFNFDTGEPEGLESVFWDMEGLAEEFGFIGINCRASVNDDSFTMYGSIFFLGIILSVVFVFAAALIIYYKQMTEGFEDMPRFATMRRIGMTAREIRRSIDSQMLTVFFLPLVMAVAHLAFAFPMIQRLLLEFRLVNEPLFLKVTAIVGGAVAVLYAVVYRATSNTYYRLVSGSEREREL